jgi:hypothetical protein
VYEKSTGALLQRISPDQFWNSALVAGGGGTTGNTADPRVVFDPTSGRWFASSLDRLNNPARHILLGVSNSADPIAGWKAFLIDPDPGNLHFADYPMLGIDAEGVYVSAHMFDYRPDGIDANPPLGVTVISVPKSDLLAPVPAVSNATVFALLDPGVQTNPFVDMQPVVDFGPADGREPMITSHPMRVDILTPAAGATLTNRINITGGPALTEPPDAPQPGTTTLIETGSHYLRGSPLKVGNSIWSAFAVGDNGRAVIRWTEIDAITNTIRQSGTIGSRTGDPNLFLFYPSIAANSVGDVVIGFSGSSATQNPSAYAVVGRTTGGTTTFGEITLLQAGYGNFLGAFVGPVRWGDYSATVIDPSDPSVFWTFQEYTSAKDAWGINISQIRIGLSSQRPIANVESYQTDANKVLTRTADAGVIINDSDPEGAALTARLVRQPTNGSVVLSDNGGFSYTPGVNFVGADWFEYQADDGGTFSTPTRVTITVLQINDPPSFAGGEDQTVTDEDGPRLITGWATSISPGPSDEMEQLLTFVVQSNSNPALFAEVPAIDAAGNLAITPTPNVSGSAEIEFVLTDGGGTANGGSDTSTSRILTITVIKPHRWHNVARPLDVQPDGTVVPADAVEVINYINAFGSGAVPPDAVLGPPYIDVIADNQIAPIDALTVINYINAFGPGLRGPGAAGEGEGAAGTAPPQADDPMSDLMAMLAADVALQPRRRR